ncbi:Pimeloyl-ACP methyl ester carboxylesterase [Thermodesulfobium acidiphilum]|uniref:Pimeloyl-ACP methyl ester carboxylesterase n=1 Tax=Thermodesulfobium acidiphilum TaxID=1794699 RepID=A0A2R4W1M2_THEAF|nr:alpha/beta hydrolase [Thermodesulfobium acidiphilum]AWB10695.1 Pimeloyl-ACP methyl ester carboxylesterase [Thermodesulfobium acidiphilum]
MKRLLVSIFLILFILISKSAYANQEFYDLLSNTYTRYTNTESSIIAYKILGEKNKKTIVMLEPFSSSMNSWDDSLVMSLLQNFRLIFIDYPGIGQSRFLSNNDPDIRELAQAVKNVLRNEKIKSANILGYSLGGFVAQQFARMYPDMVDSLILISTNAGGPNAIKPQDYVVDALFNPLPDIEKQGERVMKVLFPKDEVDNYKIKMALIYQRSSPDITPRVFNYEKQIISAWYLSNVNQEELKGKDFKTLILSSDQDLVVPPENASILHKILPNSKLIIFKGAGHALIYQMPSEVATAIRKFLE